MTVWRKPKLRTIHFAWFIRQRVSFDRNFLQATEPLFEPDKLTARIDYWLTLKTIGNNLYTITDSGHRHSIQQLDREQNVPVVGLFQLNFEGFPHDGTTPDSRGPAKS